MLINIPDLQSHKLPADKALKLIEPKHPLQIGKILTATVIDSHNKNTLTLSINGQIIKAKTTHQFTAGQELSVKINKQDNETFIKIQQPHFSKKLLSQALRHVLPKQAPPSQIINTAMILKNSLSVGSEKNIPPQVIESLKNLTNHLPTLRQLSDPIGLKKSIENSGVFLENKLLQNGQNKESNPSLSYDFKNQLLKLLKSLDTTIETKNEMTTVKNVVIPQNNPLTYTSIAPKNIPTFDQAVRLLSAANLIRHSAIPPTQKRSKDSKKGAAHSVSHKVNNYTALTTGKVNSSIKNASLPIKGAFPQPITKITTGNTPPIHTLESIKEEVTSALSRIQANQLSSLLKDPPFLTALLLDIPVIINEKTTEVLPFLIKEESHSKEEKDKNWSISIAIELDKLGPIQIKVNMKQDIIHINLWSQLYETQLLFETNDLLLKEALKEEQIEVGLFSYFLGLKENEINAKKINLLDQRV